MIEAAVVLDLNNEPLYWHLPSGRTSVSIPDSDDLWSYIWKNRFRVSGIAHSHPGSGVPSPSHTDITTFDAMERGLGRKCVWWITSKDDLIWIVNRNTPLEYDTVSYKEIQLKEPHWAKELRIFSSLDRQNDESFEPFGRHCEARQ